MSSTKPVRICSVEGCERTIGRGGARGFCKLHYRRMRTSGELQLLPKLSTEERFWAKVKKTEDCWLWTAGTFKSGYGEFSIAPQTPVTAHSYSYKLVYGEVPDGMEIDHKCRIRACVNPAHLRAATHPQNSQNLPALGRGLSGVRGVIWSADRNKWIARITHNYRGIHIGYYATVEEAEAAVIAARLSIFTHNEADRERTPA